jgi:hypothetical protein
MKGKKGKGERMKGKKRKGENKLNKGGKKLRI